MGRIFASDCFFFLWGGGGLFSAGGRANHRDFIVFCCDIP